MRDDGAVQSDELDRLGDELDAARSGPAAGYAVVLERALAAYADDPGAADYFDVLELHSELAETYDRMGRVEDALRHADVLAAQGYASEPDPRCRRAEILTRHGRLAEAGAIWDAVAADTPDDVWVFNNAGLEYGAIGEHEIALSWLTRALELAVRTGDPERLIGQLRDLRAASLAAVGREPDELQTAQPASSMPRPRPVSSAAEFAAAFRGSRNKPAVWAWLPASEYAQMAEHWADLSDSELVLDEAGDLVSHQRYCRRTEDRMREASRAGVSAIRIVPLRWPEFTAWAADTHPDQTDVKQLRAAYGSAMLRQQPEQVITWPPGRNDACWCGSGRKYKKCCGTPGLDGAW